MIPAAMTTVVSIDPLRPAAAVLREAVGVLRAGGRLVYPTDTFYGLGADARNPDAVRALALAKGRADDRPMPILIGDAEQLVAITAPLSDLARMLVDRFWPGALTLVLPVLPGWEHLASAEGRVGVRLPDHPIPRALAILLGGPIVGTSANRSGEPTPRDRSGILAQLSGRVDLLLDAGELPPSKGSTVLDLSDAEPRTIREGDLPLAAVRDALADFGMRARIAEAER